MSFFLSSSLDRRDFVFSMRFSFLWSYLLLHFYVCLTLLIVDSKLFCFLFFALVFSLLSAVRYEIFRSKFTCYRLIVIRDPKQLCV